MTTRGAALAAARARLTAAGVDGAALDARVLLCHVLGCGPETLVGWPERPMGDDEARRLDELVGRRTRREPVAYLVGSREFWGLPFHVSPATLIPRPDSETLVEAALDGVPDRLTRLRILDVGTGTGCLLIAVLRECPAAIGVGVDVVPAALDLARRNADDLGVAARAAWVADLDSAGAGFDLAIANLPYIPSGDLAGLDDDVRRHEPVSALDGGRDGLDVFRAVLPMLPARLVPGGRVLLEVGAGQAPAVEALAAGLPGLELRRRWRDLAGVERVVELHRAAA